MHRVRRNSRKLGMAKQGKPKQRGTGMGASRRWRCAVGGRSIERLAAGRGG